MNYGEFQEIVASDPDPLFNNLHRHVDGVEERRILPSQLIPNAPEARGEKALMLAVLQDAVITYQKYAGSLTRRGRRLFAEVESYITDEDREWPYSFRNLCDVFDLDSDAVCEALHRRFAS